MGNDSPGKKAPLNTLPNQLAPITAHDFDTLGIELTSLVRIGPTQACIPQLDLLWVENAIKLVLLCTLRLSFPSNKSNRHFRKQETAFLLLHVTCVTRKGREGFGSCHVTPPFPTPQPYPTLLAYTSAPPTHPPHSHIAS